METTINSTENKLFMPKFHYIFHLGFGVSKEKNRHSEKAILHYKKACSIINTNHKVHYKLGELYQQQENYVAALEHYQLAVTHCKKRHLNYSLNLAEVQLILGEVTQAIELLSSIPANSQHWKLKYLLGQLEFEHNQYEESILYYQDSLSLYPENPTVILSIAKSYVLLNQMELAQSYVEQVLAKDNKHQDANYLSGYICYQQERYADALQYFSLLPATINSPWANLIEMTALCHWQLKDYKQAEQLLLTLYKSQPNCPEILANIAAVSASLGRYEQAVDYYLELTKHHPSDATTLNNLAWCYEQLNMLDLAEECYINAIQVSDFQFRLINNYIQFLIKQENFPQAIYYLKTYLERNFSQDGWILLGNIFDQLNSHRDAVDCYNQAYQLAPSGLVC